MALRTFFVDNSKRAIHEYVYPNNNNYKNR